MKLFSKVKLMLAALVLACFFVGCSDSGNSSSSYNMHYFITEYGIYSAMIRTPDNSDVAILATTESDKGGDLYDSTFVQLTKTTDGDTYTFEGSKNGTSYKVVGKLETVSNGVTSDSFTIQSASDAMKELGFTAGKSIQHWTEKTKGTFIY
ncbi:MAG: hypothetical protein J6J00_03050 [Treponema sp.]|nr:hypothetical protein [Treponema sp.]